MSNPPLHSIQQRLITLLTSPDAFDPTHPAVIALGNEIGPDMSRVSLYARLSHAKRISKIEAVLTHTIACLGEPFHPLTRPFLAAYPPRGASRYDNARQFFDFLVRRWGGRSEERPYLLDLARYELAVAEARTQPWVKMLPRDAEPDRPPQMRRSPGVNLIRCQYDIRPLLESEDATGVPEKRSLFLAILFPRGGSKERVFEIGADLAKFLAGMSDWRPISGTNGGLEQLVALELVESR